MLTRSIATQIRQPDTIAFAPRVTALPLWALIAVSASSLSLGTLPASAQPPPPGVPTTSPVRVFPRSTNATPTSTASRCPTSTATT